MCVCDSSGSSGVQSRSHTPHVFMSLSCEPPEEDLRRLRASDSIRYSFSEAFIIVVSLFVHLFE